MCGEPDRRSVRLYWRIVLVNGVVFAIGTSMLAALLIAVSVEILLREAAVLALGAVLLLVVNGLLLRVVLAPLEQLREAMSKVDLLKPSRVEAPGIRDFQPLVETFNAMLGRLEKERVDSAARAPKNVLGKDHAALADCHGRGPGDGASRRVMSPIMAHLTMASACSGKRS